MVGASSVAKVLVGGGVSPGSATFALLGGQPPVVPPSGVGPAGVVADGGRGVDFGVGLGVAAGGRGVGLGVGLGVGFGVGFGVGASACGGSSPTMALGWMLRSWFLLPAPSSCSVRICHGAPETWPAPSAGPPRALSQYADWAR